MKKPPLISQVKLPSKSLESYSKVSPVGLSGTTLTYGPYKDLAPFLIAPMRLHYEQNTPFAEIVSLEREIEVSHWGNVYVEEVYELKHAGALHKVCKCSPLLILKKNDVHC